MFGRLCLSIDGFDAFSTEEEGEERSGRRIDDDDVYYYYCYDDYYYYDDCKVSPVLVLYSTLLRDFSKRRQKRAASPLSGSRSQLRFFRR